jgi:predicted RNA-binding protein YlqC (UPF0109 family)
LTIPTTETGSGVLTWTVGTHPYAFSTIVTLTAAPSPTSRFMGRSGDVITASNPLVLTVDADQLAKVLIDTEDDESRLGR